LALPTTAPLIAKLELVPEPAPDRLKIKIYVREQAHRRLESYEYRFWGINE